MAREHPSTFSGNTGILVTLVWRGYQIHARCHGKVQSCPEDRAKLVRPSQIPRARKTCGVNDALHRQ